MATLKHAGEPRVRTGDGRPGHDGGNGTWPFPRHYLEMVAAMFAGMVLLGAAVRGVLALAGLTFPAEHPELVALEMAFEMSAGMVVWMRYRRHGWALTIEMVGAMFVPAVALFPLLWLGVISGDTLLLGEHLLMLPLMFLVMLRRRGEYGGSAHARRRRHG
jgi:flagellar biosynthetic protein FliP